HLLHLGRTGQTGGDRLALGGDGGGRIRPDGARREQGVAGLAADGVDDQLMARPQDLAGPRAAGAADADEPQLPDSQASLRTLSQRIFFLLVSLSGSVRNRSMAPGYFESPCG